METRHTTSPLIHSKNNNPPEEKQILPRHIVIDFLFYLHLNTTMPLLRF